METKININGLFSKPVSYHIHLICPRSLIGINESSISLFNLKEAFYTKKEPELAFDTVIRWKKRKRNRKLHILQVIDWLETRKSKGAPYPAFSGDLTTLPDNGLCLFTFTNFSFYQRE